jgi:twitching motility protein PilT
MPTPGSSGIPGGPDAGARPPRGTWQRPPWETDPRQADGASGPGPRSIPLRPEGDDRSSRSSSAVPASAVEAGAFEAPPTQPLEPLESVPPGPLPGARAEQATAEEGEHPAATTPAGPQAAESPAAAEVPPELAKDLAITSMSPRRKVETWLALMVKSGASDLILRAGGRPSTRVDGRIGFLPGRVPNAGALLEVLEGVMGPDRMEVWKEVGSVDCALHLDGLGRFRLNAYKQMGEPALVLRRVSADAPQLDGLELPAAELARIALRRRGIVLVTGVAGSGKSTTLAALIQYMNSNAERHVITLEDPIEILFSEQRCVISQREVGIDVGNFHEGIRHALRQSPDVILIGEMRDRETVTAALDATETGHLVMSTMHTVNAAQTLDRILGFYPSEQHKQVRMRLADNLACVLSQRLLPRSSGKGLVPACELMTQTPRIRELLEEGNTGEIARTIEGGNSNGLVSFNQSLRRLVQGKLIDLKDALAASDRPDELVLALRGITSGVRGRQAQQGSAGTGGRRE